MGHRIGRRSVKVAPRMVAASAVLALAVAACGGTVDESETVESGDDGAADSAEDDDGAADTDAGDADESDGQVDGSGEAVELLMQSYIGQGTAYGQTLTAFIEEVEEDGHVVIEDLWDGSLVAAPEILFGLQDGRLGMGHFSNAYHPGTFPLTEVVEVPFVTDNVPAQMATMNRLYRENEAFRSEWHDQGLHILTFLGAPPSISGAREPFDSFEFYEGKRVRTSGATTAAVAAIGGEPVSLPVGEMYEGLERGTVDMFAGMILDILPQLSLHEIAPYAVDPGMGLYAVTHLNMPLEQWESLSDEAQASLTEAADRATVRLMEEFERLEDEACDVIFDSGGTVSMLGEEDVEEWAAIAFEPILDDWKNRAREAGIDDPDGFWEEYRSILAEYEEEYSDYRTGVERCVESRG